MREKIIRILFIFGIILACINVSGFFLPLRSPDVYQLNNGTNFQIDLTEQQVWVVAQNTSLERKQYLIEVNSAIHRGVAQYWGDKDCLINGKNDSCIDPEGIEKFHLRVPIYENYILFGMSYIFPEHFLKYFFTDYQKALERGIGVCDEHTIILDGILKSKNIESRMIDTPHHFFEIALADPQTNEWWILDPDYGVVIPYSLEQVQKTPELIRRGYLEEGYSNETINYIVNNVYQNHEIKIHSDISDYSTKLYPFERLSYILIWVIPLICILPFTIGILHKTVKKYKRKKQ
jgi:hypothetical protein